MSDLDALAQKISALTDTKMEFDDGARVISALGVPHPLVAVLLEIDDTVLERRLVFANGSSTVSLVVSGRRLRGIHSTTPESDAPVIGKMLTRDATDDIMAVQTILSDILGSATRMTVQSLPTEQFGKNDQRGISTGWLAELWQNAAVEDEDEESTPVTRFLKATRMSCTSVLHIHSGEVVNSSGEVDALQSIWNTQVASFRKMHIKAVRRDEDPKLICLEGALEGGASVALAIHANEAVLVACQPDAISMLNASWRDAVGS